MNDKSKTKTQKAQRRDIEFETENRGSLTLSPKPELERQNKPENPDEKPSYAGYIFFGSVTCAAIAALMFWSNSRVFLDAHAGSISALATIAIMVLTFAYVIYAKSQWKVMDGQLKEMRDTGIQMGQQVEVMRGQLTATQDLVGAYRDGLTQNRQRDRARVVIVLDRINPQPDVNLGVTCRLENGGQGRAFILNSLGKFVYSNTTDINPGIPPNWSLFFGEFLDPGQPIQQMALVPVEPGPQLTLDEIIKMRGGERFLHFYGFVLYSDVYDQIWRRNIHKCWVVRLGGVIPGQTTDWWEPVSPEENGEIEETAEQRQPKNP